MGYSIVEIDRITKLTVGFPKDLKGSNLYIPAKNLVYRNLKLQSFEHAFCNPENDVIYYIIENK